MVKKSSSVSLQESIPCFGLGPRRGRVFGPRGGIGRLVRDRGNDWKDHSTFRSLNSGYPLIERTAPCFNLLASTSYRDRRSSGHSLRLLHEYGVFLRPVRGSNVTAHALT